MNNADVLFSHLYDEIPHNSYLITKQLRAKPQQYKVQIEGEMFQISVLTFRIFE